MRRSLATLGLVGGLVLASAGPATAVTVTFEENVLRFRAGPDQGAHMTVRPVAAGVRIDPAPGPFTLLVGCENLGPPSRIPDGDQVRCERQPQSRWRYRLSLTARAGLRARASLAAARGRLRARRG